MRVFIIVTILLSVFSGMVLAKNRYSFTSVTQQRQFEQLTDEMRCMVCQNESLADSNSGFAEDMRSKIYKMVKEEKSSQQIVQYMTKRYGYFVSFNPPFYRETYVLWLAPLLLLIIAFFISRSVYKRYRGR